jgi:hypothetical protein
MKQKALPFQRWQRLLWHPELKDQMGSVGQQQLWV